ncbi:MAG: hypothetical protein EA377_11805 [Phycisphaerales bacterium]|nr:MAG: hypothetical protein EA377_11805 [Phycisphaerales bacterium]
MAKAVPRKSVVVTTFVREPAWRERAKRLAASLNLPCILEDDLPADSLQLRVHPEGMELAEPADRPGRGLMLRAPESWFASHAPERSKKQLLGRALGRSVNTVIDATGGLGEDALRLALMGFDVRVVERQPVLAAMLDDAMTRLEGRLEPGRMMLVRGDARELLPALNPRPDAVYIDPMFPPKRRVSALPRKSIQVIRELAGDDPDAADLVMMARQVALQRVVVKRPDHAPPLVPEPSHDIRGKLVRYDVYLNV